MVQFLALASWVWGQILVLLSERGCQREMIEYVRETRQHILHFPRKGAERVRASIL